MKTMSAGLLLALTLACWGGKSHEHAAPVLTDFILSPDTATQNENGGVVSANATAYFTAAEADVTSVNVTLGGQLQNFPMASLTGQTSGSFSLYPEFFTSTVGTMSMSIQLLTSHGKTSNVLTRVFTVTPASTAGAEPVPARSAPAPTPPAGGEAKGPR